jgi:hypothetical protein
MPTQPLLRVNDASQPPWSKTQMTDYLDEVVVRSSQIAARLCGLDTASTLTTLAEIESVKFDTGKREISANNDRRISGPGIKRLQSRVGRVRLLAAFMHRHGFTNDLDRGEKLKCAESMAQWADGALARLHTKISIFLVLNALLLNQAVNEVVRIRSSGARISAGEILILISIALSTATLLPSFLSIFSNFYLHTDDYVDPASDADATLRLFYTRAKLHNLCVFILMLSTLVFVSGVISLR